jgi:cell wall-associated NlpC family hydrolase
MRGMKKILLCSVFALLSACGSVARHADHAANEGRMNDLVMYAVSLADTPYRYGGDSPDDGFDCSGFVGHVFQHELRLKLPRTSHDLSRIGTLIKTYQLQPGDLVFFNTQERSYSHVGIFIGEGKFVHAPKSGSRIRVENMNEPYWAKHYNGARRVKV